ncbi:hypothetical protein FRC07_010286, partial [Ceratobasidium sp. 392]
MINVQALADSVVEHRAAEAERQAAKTARAAAESEQRAAETESKQIDWLELGRLRTYLNPPPGANAKLRELKPADRAGYDPVRQCIAGTRIGVIDELTHWAQKPGPGPCFAWVRGHAGLGKSSVATSLCLRLNDQHSLASSFFCKRDGSELRDPRRVLTTIVYGLALQWEAYKAVVVAAIREDPELHSRHIQPMYDLLIGKPLHQLAKENPFSGLLTVVVDALDECGEVTTRRQLLACLRSMSQHGPWLRVIVTSRPDLDIQEFFKSREADWFTEYDLAKHDASNDIRVYVRNQLSDMTLEADWPGDASDQIADRASGLFIWARTACRFIEGGLDRLERLQLVLAGSQLADIDSLYATAIMNSMPDAAKDNRDRVLQCLGAVVVTAIRSPLSTTSLAVLLKDRIPRRVLEQVLKSLSSVVYVDQKLDGAIRIFHPSFMDYLIDPARSQDLCVDLAQQNAILAECCCKVMMQSLRFNICRLQTSDVFNTDVPDLPSRVEESIPPHLRYSCFYWSSHSVDSQVSAPLEDSLRRFLLGRELMYWVEALSLLGRLNTGLASLLEFMQRQTS